MSILNPNWAGIDSPDDDLDDATVDRGHPIADEYSTRSCNMPTPYSLLEDVFAYADIYDLMQTEGGVLISGYVRKTNQEFAFTARNLDEAVGLALDFCWEQEWLVEDILETNDLTFTELRDLVNGEIMQNPLIVADPALVHAYATAGQTFIVRTEIGDFRVTPVEPDEYSVDFTDEELAHAQFDWDSDEAADLDLT